MGSFVRFFHYKIIPFAFSILYSLKKSQCMKFPLEEYKISQYFFEGRVFTKVIWNFLQRWHLNWTYLFYSNIWIWLSVYLFCTLGYNPIVCLFMFFSGHSIFGHWELLQLLCVCLWYIPSTMINFLFLLLGFVCFLSFLLFVQ